MRGRPTFTLRPALVLGIFVSISILSCGGGGILSFSWKSALGKNLDFNQGVAFPKGREGKFSKDTTSNRYILKESIRAEKDLMVAVDLNIDVDGLETSLAFSPERKPRDRARSFLLPKGRSTVYLNIPPEGGRSLSVSFAPAVSENFQIPSGEWASLSAIAFVPEFHGLDKSTAGQQRVSEDFIVQTLASTTRWLLPAPTQDSAHGVEVLVLDWAERSNVDILISAGATSLRLRPGSVKKSALIPLSVLNRANTSTATTLTFPTSIGLRSAYIETVGAERAEAVDPGVILLLPSLDERADFTYRAWDLLPGVYILDFRNYAVQDQYLKRLAFFVEKRGFAGRLASDAEIAPLHGWNAHDYKAEDLAAFFSEVDKVGFKLGTKEENLRDFLISKRIITKEKGGYRGSGGSAFISITQEAPAYLRRLFLTHESAHAIFFVNVGYRKLASLIWDSMDKDERWFWKLYFGWMNYDTSSNYLMANEIQAYLIQQPVAGVTKYFTETLPARLLEKHPKLEGELNAYFDRFGSEFTKKAIILDTWLRREYGFGAGTTIFLR